MKLLKIVATFLFFFLVIKTHSQNTSKDGRFDTAGKVLKNAVLTVPGDFSEMGNIVSDDWGVTAAYLGGFAGLVLVDEYTTKFYQDEIETRIDYKIPSITNGKTFFLRGNDAYLSFSLMAMYGGSFIGNYETGQRAAINSVKALTYSYLISQFFLKTAFSRNRPDPYLSDGIPPSAPFTEDPYDFGNYNGIKWKQKPDGTSFPSFHATAYFAVAQVLALEFNNYWIPYSAISFLFLADIKSHQHWVSDMVVGGILGTLIGKAIVRSSRKREERQKNKALGVVQEPRVNYNYQIVPQFSDNQVGVLLSITF